MPESRTDSETAKKAQALREAAELGCTGAHRHPDGTWMACSTMEEYERLTDGEKEKSALDVVEETQNIRSQKGRRRKRKNKRQWEKLREQGVAGIDTLPGGGLVSAKGMTFRPVDGDTDVFDNINQARRRARQLGCIGVARRISRSGRRVWTPCTNMTDYARATGSTALGRRYQQRLERQRIRDIVRDELSRLKRRKKRLFEEVYEVKRLGSRIGQARRAVAVFDPNAWDGDNDGIVQEGTPWERPSIPGINTNLPGQRHTRQKPRSYPKDSPSRREGTRGMRSSRPTSPRIMRGRNWDEEPDDDLPPISTPSGRMIPGQDYQLERLGRTEDPTPDDRPMGTGDGERLPGRDELRRMSGPEFKQWLADERKKIGITNTSHPAYPHPALTHREHFIDTEMVPVEFFDDVPGRDITDPDKLAQLKSGIKTDGFREPIKLYYNPETGVVNLSDGDIYTAAKELGIPNVPVRISTTTRSVDGKGVREGRLANIDGGKPSQVGIPTEKIPAHTEKLRLMQSMYGGNTSGPSRRMKERASKRQVGMRSQRKELERFLDDEFVKKYGQDRAQGHGDCYGIAAEIALSMGSDSEEYPDLKLVHGEPMGQGKIEGIRHGHSWVEFTDPRTGLTMVVDKSNGKDVTIPADLYYSIGLIDPDDVNRYTPKEARLKMLDTEHYGPWEPTPKKKISGQGLRSTRNAPRLFEGSNLDSERPLDGNYEMPQQVGLRSIRESDAINAPLEKTTKELSETYKRPNLPLKPGEPIAVQHASRSIEALERIAEDRFRLPSEQEERTRGGLDQVGLGGLYFTFEGDMVGADWDAEDEGSGERSWMSLDTLVAAQITPKRPLTLIANDNSQPHEWDNNANSVPEQLGFESWDELKAAQAKRAKELGITTMKEILDIPIYTDEDEERVNELVRELDARTIFVGNSELDHSVGLIPEALGIDLIVTRPVFGGDDHQSGDLVILDSDIIETVGVREIGRGSTHAWNWPFEEAYVVRNPESNESIRNRINKTIRKRFEDQPSASGGMRSRRDSERIRQSPETNIKEMESDIGEYLEYIAQHPNFDFARYSVYDPGHKRTGGLNEQGLARLGTDEENALWLADWKSLSKEEQKIVDIHDELWEKVDDWADFIRDSKDDRQNIEWEIERLTDEIKEIRNDPFNRNRGQLHRPRTVFDSEERDIIRAIENGEDRDTYLEREFGPFERSERDIEDGIDDPDLYEDKFRHGEDLATYRSYWDDIIDRREEEKRIQSETDSLRDEIHSLQNQLEKYNVNGSEDAQKLFREALQAKLAQRPDSRPVQNALTRGNHALDPAQGMRSRRERLSPNEKEWLKILQNSPGYWDETPVSVRSVTSDKLKNEVRESRMQGMRSSRNVGGRVMGQKILGRVRTEHRNKEQRTLYFVGGTTGAGKSSLLKDGSFDIPNAAEAAHIDPDFIKTGLDGWDPSNPGRVHEASRRSTDHIMGDAMNSGMDMVVQGTGKRTEHLREAKERGYETVGHFVYIPGKEADKRIAQRTSGGGPNIPSYFGSLIAGELRNGIVSRQITNGLYDEFFLWDNTGDTPRLVAFRNKDGHFQIDGREEFDDFFGTSGKYVEKYWRENQ